MHNKAFTLMEILIVIAILSVISITAIYFYNPIVQIKKTRDTTRKNDLAMMKRALEDFYNDMGRYPKPIEICYDDGLEERIDGYGKPATICHICSKKMSTDYSSFKAIPSLNGKSICDPSSNSDTAADYLYDFDNADKPLNNSISWARIYTKFQYLEDRSITEVECKEGCGPKPFFPYNYGITTNNVDLERKNSQKCNQERLYQRTDIFCNLCRGDDGVMQCSLNKPVYQDINCTDYCQL